VVASFCGRMSPVAVALVPVANRLGIPLLDAWAAADGIANNGGDPNYVFRLSLTDTWAMEAMLRHARERGLDSLAVMLPNTAWGRSNQAALESWVARHGYPRYKPIGYNWGDTTFADKIARVQASDLDAMLLIANEAEGAFVVQEMAALPKADRVPIIAHWGITGGDFAALTGPALRQVDLVVIQSFSFHNAEGPRADSVAARYRERYRAPVEKLHAQVGFAHAYDFTHLLALAIEQAGSADRASVRDALERLPGFAGLVREYVRPFGPGDHEALDAAQVALARFRADGTLELLTGQPEH